MDSREVERHLNVILSAARAMSGPKNGQPIGPEDVLARAAVESAIVLLAEVTTALLSIRDSMAELAASTRTPTEFVRYEETEMQ